MRYEGVKNWLKDAPEKFDFVEDTQHVKRGQKSEFAEIKDSYNKFWIYKYKTSGTNEPNWNVLDQLKDAENKKKISENKEAFCKEAEKYKIDDPDSASILLQDIYEMLWHDFVNEYFMRQNPKWSCMEREDGKITASDTMTSAMVRFTDAMKVIINSDEKQTENADKLERTIHEVYNACNEVRKNSRNKKGQEWWTKNFSIIVAATLGDDFYKLIDKKYSCMRCFLDNIHTIGNYCPIPTGFNEARSGFGRYDYWDLTLEIIYKWYCTYDQDECEEIKEFLIRLELLNEADDWNGDEVRDKLIHELLLHGKGNALYCTRWLETFGKGKLGWYNFIDTLFFQDYVEDAEHDNYMPKPFWAGHSWEHPGISYIEDKSISTEEIVKIINGRLQEINYRITERSKKIVEACRLKVDK